MVFRGWRGDVSPRDLLLKSGVVSDVEVARDEGFTTASISTFSVAWSCTGSI